MNLFVYSDESGVFDKIHEKYYTFGGVIFLSKEDKNHASNIFKNIELNIKKNKNINFNVELKASQLKVKHFRYIFNFMKIGYKFGCAIDITKVYDDIFLSKKTKQRYLDYVYKLSLKNALLKLRNNNIINLNEIENIYIFFDQHTTATDGIYELGESIEHEFKYGKRIYETDNYFPPICPYLKSVNLTYKNSQNTALIRYADIISNFVYKKMKQNKLHEINFTIIKQP